MSFKASRVMKFRICTVAVLAAAMAYLPLGAQESVPDTETPEAEAGVVEEAGSPGMSIPFDGDSIESFEESLELIRAETTADEYTTVENALDYLLVYDLGARRNRELLYERLDGKTPNDVLDMVNWRQEGGKNSER